MPRLLAPVLLRVPSLALLFGLVLTGLGCAQGDNYRDAQFEITAPTADQRVGSNAVRIVGLVGDPRVREVLVDGEAVGVVRGEFQTTLRLPDGPHTISALGGEHFASVSFVVDGRAPTVIIDEPRPGAFIEGDTLHVEGRVTDATDVTLTVLGEPLELAADGSFHFDRTVAPGAHRVRVVAEDSVGHVSSAFTTAIVGHFGDLDASLPRAASVALGETALEAISAVVEPMLSPTNVRPMVMAGNPIAEGAWGELNTLGEDHGPVSVEFTPLNDALRVVIRVPSISVPFAAPVSGGFTITGTMHVEEALIVVAAGLDAADGRPVVDIDYSQVTLEGVFIDVDGLWDWVDRLVVTRALRGKMERSLNEAVDVQLPIAIEEALLALPSSHEFEVQGYRAEVHGGIASLESTYAGLRAVLDFGVRPIGGRGELPRAAPGPLLLGAGAAPTAALSGIEGAVTVDLLNAALFAAWAVDGLSYRMDEIPDGDGGVVNVGLINIAIPVDGAPRDAAVAVEVSTTLPPVVEESNTGLTMAAADIRVRLYAPNQGREVLLAAISCGVRAAVSPILADDGLGLRVDEFEVTIDAVDDLGGLPPAEELDRLLGDVLRPLLEEHGELRGFEIPTVAGFDIGADELFVDDGYVVFRGQLAPAR
ncbi:MAG: hypothetical protein DRJ42_20815 [Deltaproteobacteria bacterium]|nr:MAG: hypothetical protein DRJ42_20815 [Deltaproteobacteria bacterium]